MGGQKPGPSVTVLHLPALCNRASKLERVLLRGLELAGLPSDPDGPCVVTLARDKLLAFTCNPFFVT